MEATNTRNTVRRFVRKFLSTETPDFFVHQTLTFREKPIERIEAHKRLKRLLESRSLRGSLFVEEYGEEEGIHFHVLLYFYKKDGLPFKEQGFVNEVSRYIFATWNRINRGILLPEYNALKVHTPDFRTIDYVTKETRFIQPHKAPRFQWWGIRKAKFLRKGQPPSNATVMSILLQIYGPRPRVPFGMRVSRRTVASEKRYCLSASISTHPERDWEESKQRKTGRSVAVSDAEYLAFKKDKVAKWLATQRALVRELRKGPHHSASEQK